MNKRQQIKALKKEIARLRASHNFYKAASFGALYGMEPRSQNLKDLARTYVEEQSPTGRILADYGEVEARLMPGWLAAQAKTEQELT